MSKLRQQPFPQARDEQRRSPPPRSTAVQLHGSSGIGAIGYLLRVTRHRANSIMSITIVLADGTVAAASADEDADLFWALRGYGGGFGAVTSITIRLRFLWKILTGTTIWDAEHADALLSAWRPGRYRSALDRYVILIPWVPRPTMVSYGRQDAAMSVAVHASTSSR